MYEYYKCASTCYVYLADLEKTQKDVTLQDLQDCRWFTRSWTLQELIAPKAVSFFDRYWCEVGTKEKLLEVLVKITRIDAKAFQYPKDLSSFSVAQRMSWAANRDATREEDVAYSLLGIFNVNMPLLYGEGTKAFLRLQEEIMRQSDDQSLFAWGDIWTSNSTMPPPNWEHGAGFLATSPTAFKGSNNVVSYSTEADHIWTMTNKGIQIAFPTANINGRFAFLLNCSLSSDLTKRLVIHSTANPENAKLHRRHALWLFDRAIIDRDVRTDKEYFWEKNTRTPFRTENERFHGILIKLNFPCNIKVAVPSERWNPNGKIFRAPPYHQKWFAHVQFEYQGPPRRYFLFVFIAQGVAYVDITDTRLYMLPEFRLPGFDEQVLNSINISYDWKSRVEDPAHSLKDVCTAYLSNAYEIQARVKKEDVMGQPMFVVDVTEVGIAQKQQSKGSLVSSLKRLTFG